MFYTRVPDGFQKVDDIRLEDGKLIIDDRAGRRLFRSPHPARSNGAPG